MNERIIFLGNYIKLFQSSPHIFPSVRYSKHFLHHISKFFCYAEINYTPSGR